MVDVEKGRWREEERAFLRTRQSWKEEGAQVGTAVEAGDRPVKMVPKVVWVAEVAEQAMSAATDCSAGTASQRVTSSHTTEKSVLRQRRIRVRA